MGHRVAVVRALLDREGWRASMGRVGADTTRRTPVAGGGRMVLAARCHGRGWGGHCFLRACRRGDLRGVVGVTVLVQFGRPPLRARKSLGGMGVGGGVVLFGELGRPSLPARLSLGGMGGVGCVVLLIDSGRPPLRARLSLGVCARYRWRGGLSRVLAASAPRTPVAGGA